MDIATVKDSIILLSRVLCFMSIDICGQWCYPDHLRKTNANDIVFVTEHKLFNCEVFKLNYDRNWHAYMYIELNVECGAEKDFIRRMCMSQITGTMIMDGEIVEYHMIVDDNENVL